MRRQKRKSFVLKLTKIKIVKFCEENSSLQIKDACYLCFKSKSKITKDAFNNVDTKAKNLLRGKGAIDLSFISLLQKVPYI